MTETPDQQPADEVRRLTDELGRAREDIAFLERVTLPELRRQVEHHKEGKQRWRDRAEKAEAAVMSAGPAPATDRAALVETAAQAMREHYLVTNREEADADGNMPCRCGDWREPGPMGSDEDDWDSHLAAAVLAELPETARLHDEILTQRADLAKVRDLLRTENRRGNDAIDREETAEEAALEAQQDLRRLRLMVDEYGAGASALTGKLKQLRDIGHRLAAHAVGFQDELDASDRGPWARTVGADIAELCAVLDAPAAPVLPASTGRPAVLGEAEGALRAEAKRMTGEFNDSDLLHEDGPAAAVATWKRAADLLRRMADETPQPEAEATESVIYEVVGDWGVDSADSAEGARAAVAKWLRTYPKCGAFAQQRIYRDWPDGSEFYGPWTGLPPAPAVVAQPDEEA